MENAEIGAPHHQALPNRRNNVPRMNLEDLMQFANNNVIQLFGGTIQLRISKFLDILLRLPPLFLMDQVVTLGFITLRVNSHISS